MKLFYFILFTLCFIKTLKAQQPNDCRDAIVICGNGEFKSNASGVGQTQEVSGCGSKENNSIWLEINIVQSGKLGFDLIPNSSDLKVDYDFWIFGPNSDCDKLGTPIRCSTTNPLQANLSSNHTGIDGSNSNTNQGPGPDGTGYVSWLDVSDGEKYYIVIDRPHGDGGFTINWTGTANEGFGAFPVPPKAERIGTLYACSNSSKQTFNLDELREDINSDLSSNKIQFYETYANAFDNKDELPNQYTNIENPQTIYAKATSLVTHCFTIIEFNLKVEKYQEVKGLKDLITCDSNKDGKAQFDLTKNELNILKELDNTSNYTITYYTRQEDVHKKVNPITTPKAYTNEDEGQTIWVRLENKLTTQCYGTGSFQLFTYTDGAPKFQLEKVGSKVSEKSKLIVKNIEGVGPYEFRLNNREWVKISKGQTTLSYLIDEGGEYVVEGRHAQGCGNKILSVIFLDYPKFFTPNGDGYNEYWNVEGAANLRFKSEIYIFDRYGKLLRSIDPKSLGWDGFYNGKPMPAGDYWFLFEYEQTLENGELKVKRYRSNITLLR